MVKQKQHVAGQLARQFCKVAKAHNEADNVRDRHTADALQVRMDALREEVTWHNAGCGAGALFQLGTAACIVEIGMEGRCLVNDDREDVCVITKNEALTLTRILQSLAAFVEANSNDRRSDFDRSYLGI